MGQAWQGWAMLVSGAAAMLAGCGAPDGINEKGEIFAAIGKDETVSLVGTEPFWTLEINGAAAVWTTPELPGGMRFDAARFAGNNGLSYSGKLDGADLTATITPGACNDGMSDREFPFTATVKLGEQTFKGCAYSARSPYRGLDAP